MDHHIDIIILPDPEFMPTMLMSALFNKLHRALVEMQTNRVAVSFVDYEHKGKNRTLGCKLRLHGNAQNLQTLMASNWLKGMNDHIDKTAVLPIPADHQHLQVSRVQCDSNVERKRSRFIKRHNVSTAQAIEALPDSVEQRLTLPYVVLKSASTKQQFRLFINQQATGEQNLDATFNSYGLSAKGTVPAF
jgi:CRISPR-associated endonuclease Csy4